MNATTAMILLLFTTLSVVAWGLVRVGIWIGGSKSSKYIVDGFIRTLDLKPDSELLKELNRELKGHRPWYPILADDYYCGRRSFAVGEAFADAGFSQGFESHGVRAAPKPEEAAVTMKRDELSDIAWLADYGLRVWTSPSSDEIRVGERLRKNRAEKLAELLDKFERNAADLFLETEDEREMRFSHYENRMKRMWENYG